MTAINTDQVRVLSPLQFEIQCDKDSVYNHIIALRQFALENFDRVTKVFRLYDSDCQPLNDSDPLFHLKAMSVGLMVRFNRIVTLQPRSIIAFAFQMPNGRAGYMGLSTYADTVEMTDSLVIETPLRGKAHWCGQIETFKIPQDVTNEEQEVCIESHRLSCKFLDQVQDAGILVSHYDATGYFLDRNEEVLARLGQLVCKGHVRYENPKQLVGA